MKNFYIKDAIGIILKIVLWYFIFDEAKSSLLN